MRNSSVSGTWARRIAVTAAATLLAGAGLASSAQASVAQGGVYGTGVVTDDWGDEGPLSMSSNSHNSVVGLWQAILAADLYLPPEDIDCYFGEQTAAATRLWQKDHDLGKDGIVGPLTFGKADNSLYWVGSEIRYSGSHLTLYSMHRTSSGRWYANGGGTTVYFSYTNADFCG
ncbi:peptidoglycan-binding protein [Streptomyces sp. NPDC019531]|uniref:peptidoglycan-binding domain-containing protein n=1 Tax=Streptomyces sp. NPDC019531 TaxID=3365062 RepID=UPI00384DA995